MPPRWHLAHRGSHPKPTDTQRPVLRTLRSQGVALGRPKPTPRCRHRMRRSELGAAGFAEAVIMQASKITSPPAAPQVTGKELT